MPRIGLLFLKNLNLNPLTSRSVFHKSRKGFILFKKNDVLKHVVFSGGDKRDRTADLLNAIRLMRRNNVNIYA